MLAKETENREYLEAQLSRLAITQHDALSSQILQMRQESKENLLDLHREANTHQGILVAKANEQVEILSGMSYRLHLAHQDADSNLKDIVRLFFGIRDGNDWAFEAAQDRSKKLETQLISIKMEQEEANHQSSLGFQSILAQLQILTATGGSLLRSLTPFSEKVLGYLKQNMRATMDIYALLLRIQASIPQGMPISQQDSIHFEDVLGRTKDLPYEYFHHWPIFESRLHCEFRGLPGEQKVLQGSYVLLNSTVADMQISKEAWERTVFPGTKVKMSVIMEDLRRYKFSCPRLHGTGTILSQSHGDPDESRCLNCGLYLFTQSKVEERLIDISDDPQSTTPPDSAMYGFQGRGATGQDQERTDLSFFRMMHMKRWLPAQYPYFYPRYAHISSNGFDLDHHLITHYPPQSGDLIDCPGRGCGRHGQHGFKRKDHLLEHLRKDHTKKMPRREYENMQKAHLQ